MLCARWAQAPAAEARFGRRREAKVEIMRLRVAALGGLVLVGSCVRPGLSPSRLAGTYHYECVNGCRLPLADDSLLRCQTFLAGGHLVLRRDTTFTVTWAWHDSTSCTGPKSDSVVNRVWTGRYTLDGPEITLHHPDGTYWIASYLRDTLAWGHTKEMVEPPAMPIMFAFVRGPSRGCRVLWSGMAGYIWFRQTPTQSAEMVSGGHGRLEVRVISSDDFAPRPGARVSLVPLGASRPVLADTADRAGRLALMAPPGAFRLTAALKGNRTIQTVVPVRPGFSDSVTVNLQGVQSSCR